MLTAMFTPESSAGDIPFSALMRVESSTTAWLHDDRPGTDEAIAPDTAIAAHRAIRRQEGIRTDIAVVADADPIDDDVVGRRPRQSTGLQPSQTCPDRWTRSSTRRPSDAPGPASCSRHPECGRSHRAARSDPNSQPR